MKRIIASLSVVAVVAAVAISATGAFFSDTATSTGNTFSSGTLDLKLSDDNESAIDDITASFGGTNLVPGQDLGADEMVVTNNGSVSGHHINLTVTLPTGLGTDLAKNIIFKLPDGDNGLRFGATISAADSDNLAAALMGISPGSGDYTFTKPDGSAITSIDGNDGTTADGKLSLNELATFGKIRITPGSNNEGVAAGTTAKLWVNMYVDSDLTTQGESVTATFTWELQQDASQT